MTRFLKERDSLRAKIDDSTGVLKKIRLLTELYYFHQNDANSQSKIIREIQSLLDNNCNPSTIA